MNSPFRQNRRIFVGLALVIICSGCCSVVFGANSEKNVAKIQTKNIWNTTNSTRRHDTNLDESSGSFIVSAIRKILPEMESTRISQTPPNFLQIVLNASGVLGLGFLWIKEISAALGTPILAPILMPPLLILAAALLLIPDLARLGELLDRMG